MYPSDWKDSLKCVPVNEWLFNGEYLDFLPHLPSRNNGIKRLLLLVTLLSLWVLLQVFMAREGPVRWKLPMTCLYCSNMLPMATISEKVTNITHCYNPFTTVLPTTQLTTLSIYLLHASGRKYNNPYWVYIMWPLYFVILQFYCTCEYRACTV